MDTRHLSCLRRRVQGEQQRFESKRHIPVPLDQLPLIVLLHLRARFQWLLRCPCRDRLFWDGVWSAVVELEPPALFPLQCVCPPFAIGHRSDSRVVTWQHRRSGSSCRGSGRRFFRGDLCRLLPATADKVGHLLGQLAHGDRETLHLILHMCLLGDDARVKPRCGLSVELLLFELARHRVVLHVLDDAVRVRMPRVTQVERLHCRPEARIGVLDVQLASTQHRSVVEPAEEVIPSTRGWCGWQQQRGE
jgi:hypothetical protein